MSACDICKKGTLIEERTERSIEITCTKCGRGWHIPLIPSHNSPCMDLNIKPPEPRARIRDPFYEFDREGDRDEKPDEEED